MDGERNKDTDRPGEEEQEVGSNGPDHRQGHRQAREEQEREESDVGGLEQLAQRTELAAECLGSSAVECG